MLKELLDVLKNWLSEQKPVLIPIPVKADRSRMAVLLLGIFMLSGSLVVLAQSEAKTILFLGDSLTAGYGIDENQAYPSLIRERIAGENLDWNVVNAGLSGETSSGGLRRINWLLRSPVDILVLALGANDGLRGVDLTLTRQNLQAIIDRVREKNPDVQIILAGMQVPPNLGQDYTEAFRNLFPQLAEQNDAVLIPFLLEDVAGIPELNLPDGIHPTPEGHQIMAETVWTYLQPVLAAR